MFRGILDNVLSGMKAGFKSILNLEHLFERNKMDNQTSRSTIVIFCKKTLLLISSVLLAYGMVVTPVLAQEKVLEMWISSNNSEWSEALVEEFNKEGHGFTVKLTIIPVADLETKLGIAAASGTMPDINTIDASHAQKFIVEGHFLDLTDKINALPYKDALIQADLDMGTYPWPGGRLHQLPYWLAVSHLVWNKDLFRKAGLDPEKGPRDIFEMMEMIEKVSALGDDIYGYYYSGACNGCMIFTNWGPITWASGGTFVNEDSTEATFLQPIHKRVAEFLRWAYVEGHVPASAETDKGTGFLSVFNGGKIGMQGAGSFVMDGFLKAEKEGKINFGVGPIPGIYGGKNAWIGGDGVVIPSTSKYPEEAWEYIKWVLSKETQMKHYAAKNHVPVRTDLWDPEVNPYFKKEPRLLQAAAGAGFGTVPWIVSHKDVLVAPDAPWARMMPAAIFDGEMDFTEYQEEANKILKKDWKYLKKK
jgi:multiple sugar transport system substrate-binding protein